MNNYGKVNEENNWKINKETGKIIGYDHGDVRANQIGYISLSGGVQTLYFTNDPIYPFSQKKSFSEIEQTDAWTRVFFDTDRSYNDIGYHYHGLGYHRIYMDSRNNSLNTLRFFLSMELYSQTNGWMINDVDYSKGVLIVANSSLIHQWCTVFYTTVEGVERGTLFDYTG